MANQKFTPYALTALPPVSQRDVNGIYFIRTSGGMKIYGIANTPNRTPVELDLGEFAYQTGTLSELVGGTNTTGKLQSAKTLNDWLDAVGYVALPKDRVVITKAVAMTGASIPSYQRTQLLVSDRGSYLFDKTQENVLNYYKGRNLWKIYEKSGITGTQTMIVEAEYGNIVLADFEIAVPSVKECVLEIDFEFRFIGNNSAVFSGILESRSIDGTRDYSYTTGHSVNIQSATSSLLQIFISKKTGQDRTFAALGGDLLHIYSESDKR